MLLIYVVLHSFQSKAIFRRFKTLSPAGGILVSKTKGRRLWHPFRFSFSIIVYKYA